MSPLSVGTMLTQWPTTPTISGLVAHALEALGAGGPAEDASGRVAPGPDGQLVLRSERHLRGVATVDIRVPMGFKTRGGRKEIISVRGPSGLPPDAATTADVGPRSPLVVALARAYRWQRMIDSGEMAGVEAIATKYRMERTYIARILGLATLAPEIVDAALKGNEPSGMSVRKLMAGRLPIRWDKQRAQLAPGQMNSQQE
jgi:hypothetical protein